MRVRRLFGHPLDASVAFVLPSCLGKKQRALVVICLARDTHSRLCRTAITHSHANLPATRVGGRRLFPHNCSNAVEKSVRRYRGCGRWRAPCRRRDRLRLTGWLTWLLASHPRPGSADRLVRSCTEERSPDARSVDYCMNGGDWGRTTLRTSAWRYGCVWFVLLHRQALPIHSTFGCTKAASGMWAALAR